MTNDLSGFLSVVEKHLNESGIRLILVNTDYEELLKKILGTGCPPTRYVEQECSSFQELIDFCHESGTDVIYAEEEPVEYEWEDDCFESRISKYRMEAYKGIKCRYHVLPITISELMKLK